MLGPTNTSEMTLIKRNLIAWSAMLGLLGVFPSVTDAQEAQTLPTLTLSAGMYNIVAQVARSPQEREIGLMFRKTMAPHEGMLFVFEEPATQCFWMKNTLIPLSAAFIAEDGTIVNIEDMAPQTENSHCSRKPVRFVLEMNQGWFAKRGLKAGAHLAGTVFKNN
ncbi:DUF192 domain-containing protein [Ideonella sp. B508-1]|uniref:DUF192 domain-containing protein n=1 Tax=Ideonella sp. B508-1 TaxID=137716 RepID=UPI0035B53E0D